MVKVFHESGGTLVCCNQPMQKLEENTTDAALEKHVPVIKKIEGGYKVTVGEVEHPMLEEHYIEWIELIADEKLQTKFLKPGDKPVAIFKTEAQKATAMEYCNLHGYWKKVL